MSSLKNKKYCKDCRLLHLGRRDKRAWCCKYGNFIEKAYSICLQQKGKEVKDGESM